MSDIVHILWVMLALLFRMLVFIIGKAAILLCSIVVLMTRYVIVPVVLFCYRSVMEALHDLSESIRSPRHPDLWNDTGPCTRYVWKSRTFDDELSTSLRKRR